MPLKGSITRISSKTTPLCFLSDGLLLCYRRGSIIGIRAGKEKCSFPITLGRKERLLGWSRLASRLFRFGVRTAITIDENRVIFSIGNRLFELDTLNGKISKGWDCGAGIRPLVFSEVNSIDGFDDGIYFGAYLSNREKKPVSIFHRTGEDQWNVVYTFPDGAINHIHNIIPDPYRNCLWVFTGDFGKAAAIWKVTDNFNNVERLASNNQKYRACVVYALSEGLLYATDAPFADDYVYLLDTDTFEVKEVFPIHGSCIYGCKWGNDYVFSSTVEGDGRSMSRLDFLFSRKRGAGIKDNYVHLYLGNLDNGFKEVYKEEKDCMPFYTFQFGVFKFPTGPNNSETLYFQPVATKNNDYVLMALNL